MQYLSHILAGVFMVATALLTIHAHDTNILLDVKDSRINALILDRDTAQAKGINARNDADFQRIRCDAFYDVVGDYVDVTNQIKKRGWSDSVLPAAK